MKGGGTTNLLNAHQGRQSTVGGGPGVESALLLNAVLEQSRAAICFLDPHARILRANTRFADLVGVPAEALVGREARAQFGDRWPARERRFVRALAGESVSDECRPGWLHQDVRSTWEEDWYPVRDGAGRVAAVCLALRDVTAERQALHDLEEAEARYRTIGEAFEFGTWSTDAEGRITHLSDSFLRFLGVSTLEEAGEAGFGLASAPEEVLRLREYRIEAKERGEPVHYECEVVGASGERRTIEVRGAPLRDAEGRIKAWTGLTLDVSERARALQSLAATSKRLQLALDAAGLGSWEWDRTTGRLTWDSRQFEIYGLSPGEFEPTFDGFLRMVHAEDRQRLRDMLDRHTGGPVEFRIVRPDGAERYIQAWDHAVEVDEAGRPLRLVGLNLDVTHERLGERRAQFAARTAAQFAQSLDYETTVDSIARVAIEGLADWCSVIVTEGANAHRVVAVATRSHDRRYVDLAAYLRALPAREREASSAVPTAIRERRTVVREYRPEENPTLALQDSEYERLRKAAHFRSTVTVPMIGRGRVLGAVLLGWIQRRPSRYEVESAELFATRAAQALDNAMLLREAEEQTRLREELVLVTSHELRNPLSGLLGLGALLRRWAERHAVDPEVQEQIEMLLVTGERMRRTLDLFLDLARVEGGGLKPVYEEFDLTALARWELRVLEQRYPHLLPDARIPDSTVLVTSDSHCVQEVVANLLENAARYAGPHPHIALELETDGRDVVMRVRDDGPGIDPSERERVFERFTRGQTGAGKPGTGLGLYISRQLARLLGGDLTLDTAPGEGCTFELRFPRRPRGAGDEA